MPTSRACFTGWVPAVYLDEGASVPLGFVFQLTHEAAPTDIANRLCQLVVFQHPFHIECLDADLLVFADQLSRHLMLKITARIGNASMQLGYFLACFFTVLAPLLFLGMTPLSLSQLLFISCVVF